MQIKSEVRVGLDGRKHRRNLNVLVCGGSGAGKTRFYCKPNIMQANSSFVVLDPKGEILRDTGGLLETMGYEVRVLDLINMEKSHCYNPFVYLMDDNDVQRLVTNLFKSTTPKGAQSNDPFWDTAASMLLLALVFYLKYEAPEEEQNFAMVMELLRNGEVSEDNERNMSPLDYLFYDLENKDPDHIALKYYKSYHSGSAKTLKSIQITLAARLEKFNLESLSSLTITDELELEKLGEKKCAIFALIPDNDTSFNFLVSILYTQLFQQLFEVADKKYGGSLPVHVHFLMDEFANVSLPDDFDKILSVMRSRGVSVSIILQNLDNRYALLFIRGERPVKDLKFDILRHPNVKLTTDGGSEDYRHGEDTISKAVIEVLHIDPKSLPETEEDAGGYTLISDEELEDTFSEKKKGGFHLEEDYKGNCE